MLTVTEDAATLINTLIGNADRTARSGLRIAIDPNHDSLSMSLVDDPSPADDIVESPRARVFLSPSASRRLEKRILRAASSDTRSSFYLG